jgi:NADPH2:quinone reductase
MRAAISTEYGPPEGLVVQDVPDPVAGPGEVVVDVAAAAVNFPDILILANSYQASWPLPMIPGSEFAGRVSQVGDGVTNLRVGDRVSGSVAVGAFAEKVAVRADSLWKLPETVDAGEAAAFRVAYMTAYSSLRSVADVQPGEWVVVLGAGGGVGLASVDVAKLLGAKVVAVASSDAKLEVCRERGADATINYTTEDLKQRLKDITGGGANVVIDPVGGRHAEDSIRASRYGGRYVCVGFASGEIPRIPMNLLLLKGVILKGFGAAAFGAYEAENSRRDNRELQEHFAAGRLRTHVWARYGLGQVAAAMHAMGNREVIGKIVIEIGEE